MKKTLITQLITIAMAAVGIFLINDLLTRNVTGSLELRLAGSDSAPTEGPTDEGPIVGTLIQFEGVALDLVFPEPPGAWPRFRGENFDNIAVTEEKLAESWPADGPPVIWELNVGEGYAGAVVLNGRVYMIDYDRENQADVIRCLSLADGNDIWQYSYPVKVKRNHGMSRTVPAVTDKYIVTMGPKCHVTCLDSVTGEFKWLLDLVKDFGTEIPQWYAGQCPLIDDGKAIIAPAGESLMMAVDCNSGEILWKSPNPRGWKMTHSSIILAEFFGKRMYIYCGSKGIAGVSVEDGSILWDSTEWQIKIANIPTPVIVSEGMLFLSGGYNAGSMMMQLTEEDGKITAEPVFTLPAEEFGSPQQTPIFYEGYIYGVRPDGQLACLDLNGNIMWTSTSAHKFGIGPYIIINDIIYVMDDEGLLTMAKVNPAGFIMLDQAKVLEGPDSWGPMAYVDGKLIVRDLNKIKCFDITQD